MRKGAPRQKKKPPRRKPGAWRSRGRDPEAPAASAETEPFPIVGIGTSAGGLEALEKFLRPLSCRSGMAFVVVQHLEPTSKGMLPELLRRAAPMPVVQVRDRTKVKPNCVYVIPPNKDLSILRGVLHLLEPSPSGGLRLPIDFFFRSLAEDRKERSIGVILSGMGSDGTLGVRAIKEHGGAVFVQAPGDARFDGMPRSVIDAGLADVVAPAGELGAKISAYAARMPAAAAEALPRKIESGIEKICVLLRDETGHDFSEYKRNTLRRRIERRMALHQLDSIAGYLRYLRENRQERQLLFKELLIGVTGFFRDPPVWDVLCRKVIPEMIEERPSSRKLRAWVPACSTGEEAYSLAIVFREALALATGNGHSLQIFATDIDKDAIDRARLGIYPPNIAGDVPDGRLRRYFTKVGNGYQVSKDIRQTIVFAPQNLIMDPPFTRLDILSCRNMFIYLSPALQRRLLAIFHYCLNPGGVLLLGSAETVGDATGLFAPLDEKARIYRRLDIAARAESPVFPASSYPCRSPRPGQPAEAPGTVLAPNLQALADRFLLDRHTPAAVLTNDKGDILYVNGRTGKYLEPAAGKANWNIYAMAREGLRYELAAAFEQALRNKRPVTLSCLKVQTEGGERTLNVTVEPICEPSALRGMVMVLFADVPVTSKPARVAKTRLTPTASRALAQKDEEIRRLREELRSTREQMQASQEELKSANEELQSVNEELQSTNEELQAMNEELQTLNNELQSKVDELYRANNDIHNLLESTDIAILFLDEELNVRRFTSRMTKIIKLIPSDVGRPLTDLSSDLVYPNFSEDAREVLRSLNAREKIVSTTDGRWFRVRIMPYRTADNRIDGLVTTFINVNTPREA